MHWCFLAITIYQLYTRTSAYARFATVGLSSVVGWRRTTWILSLGHSGNQFFMSARLSDKRPGAALHYASFVLYLMGLFHGLFSGTDSTAGWAVNYYWISFGSLVIPAFVRIVGVISEKIFPSATALHAKPLLTSVPVTRPAPVLAATNSAPQTAFLHRRGLRLDQGIKTGDLLSMVACFLCFRYFLFSSFTSPSITSPSLEGGVDGPRRLRLPLVLQVVAGLVA